MKETESDLASASAKPNSAFDMHAPLVRFAIHILMDVNAHLNRVCYKKACWSCGLGALMGGNSIGRCLPRQSGLDDDSQSAPGDHEKLIGYPIVKA
ncbi:MAG TPA: hypothetical protein VJP02_25545 [Candidatus Sulfotelmatobacter sp.]|nr:hypothetical protein [Candidatus Sulfotelmatobacter sp.]